MKSLVLTNEYPPHTYGGAGVHVEYLSRELAKIMQVEVRCFGDQDVQEENLSAKGYEADTAAYTCPAQLKSVFAAAQRSLAFNTTNIDADLIHCHTWYTHLAGIMGKLNYGLPLVVTVHSLEPLRPWKREQLGGGYDFTRWVEKTAIEMADAVIAVSRGAKLDILQHFMVPEDRIHIIYNGIDTDEYQKTESPETLERYGINPNKPYVLFVGRITRQKGIIYLVDAIKHMEPGFQVVLCAGAPDTPEIAREMKEAVRAVSKLREGVIWVDEMVPKKEIIALYSHADLFCCPSIYEPFGIINLEAMACETPVVASHVGGIPEAVQHGETGFLVPLAQKQESPFTPNDPVTFAQDLARPINQLMGDPMKRARMAAAGRKRAIEHFSWTAVARQTKELYESVLVRRHG